MPLRAVSLLAPILLGATVTSFARAGASAVSPRAAAASPKGSAASPPAWMKIGSRKYPTANDVKMTVLAPGSLEPMNATIRQKNAAVVLQIVQGGSTSPKAVEIDHGRCPKPANAQFHLPPFRGNQYQATVSHTKLSDVQDGKHALAIFSSNGRRRTVYACGDLNPPNALLH